MPLYAPPAKGQVPNVVGFKAVDSVSIRVDRLPLLGRLIDAAVDAGATNMDSISFGLKDDRPTRRKALAQALSDARAKAEALAPGLGARIGEAVQVEEGQGSTQPRYQDMGSSNLAYFQSGRSTVMAGTLDVSATITVRYRLMR